MLPGLTALPEWLVGPATFLRVEVGVLFVIRTELRLKDGSVAHEGFSLLFVQPIRSGIRAEDTGAQSFQNTERRKRIKGGSGIAHNYV